MRLVFRALLAIGLSSSAAAAQAASASPEQAQAAERLFQSGTRAFEATEYKRAIEHLAESYRLFPSYRTACGLGQVELHLSRYRDAAEHLDFCLKNFPASDASSTQQRILDGLAEARRRVFALGVRTQVSGAEVRIDGKLVGVTPRTHDFFVEPGNHQVEVSKPGYQPHLGQFFFPSGGQRDWVVTLVPQPVQPVNEQPGGGSGYVLATGAALTGVLIAGGVLFRVSADNAARDARELQRDIEASGDSCRSGTDDRRCFNLRRAQERQDQMMQVSSISLLSAAGSAVLSTLLYGVLLGNAVAEPVTVAANVHPEHVEFCFSGRF
jgi:PEGA domain